MFKGGGGVFKRKEGKNQSCKALNKCSCLRNYAFQTILPMEAAI